MKRTPDVLAIVSRFIQREGLFRPGEKILAAVSGGGDSLCLVLVLKELGYPLHVAHFDHQLRAGSGSDAEFVRRAAERLGLPATIGRGDVRAHAAGKKMTLEEAARSLRYDFLRRAAGEASAAAIATGHTLDDQAETVLLHLIRGAGVRGLGGIRPTAPVPGDQGTGGAALRIRRPLLDLTHSQTTAYCRQAGWEPLEDATNLDPAFTRNKIRRELIPLLETYNPAAVSALARLAGIARDQEEYIDQAAVRLWGQLADEHEAGLARLPREKFHAAPVAVRRELVRLAVGRLAGDLEDLAGRHVDQVLEFEERPSKSKRMDLALGIAVFLEGDWIAFQAGGNAPAEEDWAETILPIPGRLAIHNPDWIIKTEWLEHPIQSAGNVEQALWEIYIDPDRIQPPLRFRKKKPGDRFFPSGMAAPVRLSDFFSSHHVPLRKRNIWPVLCDEEGIIWVPGYRLKNGITPMDFGGRVLKIMIDTSRT
jgi:tRNA(Ile)-lysidine synthase